VDQSGNGRDITKGRQREQGAVKISCERQDPNARNCHGYRKFVRRSVLEAPNSGYLVDDTIVIRYEIDLVVTSGGALNKSSKQTQSFVVDIGKQMKMGEHLVKLLPPSQSWRKREKRMMLANGLGKRSLMLGGGGSNKTGGGGGRG
jgi:speckle-type POZ protein